MIKEWISQVIVFLLLATLIDLLIPASRMQKYVRLAVGLIMMLIFLKPVFVLFNTDIEQVIQQKSDQLLAQESNGNLKNNLEFQKKEIVGAQHAYISEQMAVQLKKTANPILKKAHHSEIANIELEFAKKDDLTAEQLDKVVVTLQGFKEEGAVAKVDKIMIGERTSKSKRPHDEAGIRQTLLKAWGLKDEQLTLLWEGAAS